MAQTPPRDGLLAILKPVLLQFTFDDSKLTINGYIPRTNCTYGRSGRIYVIRPIHIQRCHRWPFQLWLPSARIDGVIFVTDALRSTSSAYGMIQLWLPISFVYGWSEFRIVEQRLQIVWQLHKGSIITPEWSKVANHYESRLTLSIISFRIWLDDQIGSLSEEREPSAPARFDFVNGVNESWSIANQRIWICAHTMAFEEGFEEHQGDDCYFVAGILRIHGATGWTVWALSGDQWIQHEFQAQRGSIVVSYPHVGMDGYLVFRHPQLGVTSMWFAQWAYSYTWWRLGWIHCELETEDWYEARNPSVNLQCIWLWALQRQGERKQWPWTGKAIRYALALYLDHG